MSLAERNSNTLTNATIAAEPSSNASSRMMNNIHAEITPIELFPRTLTLRLWRKVPSRLKFHWSIGSILDSCATMDGAHFRRSLRNYDKQWIRSFQQHVYLDEVTTATNATATATTCDNNQRFIKRNNDDAECRSVIRSNENHANREETAVMELQQDRLLHLEEERNDECVLQNEIRTLRSTRRLRQNLCPRLCRNWFDSLSITLISMKRWRERMQRRRQMQRPRRPTIH